MTEQEYEALVDALYDVLAKAGVPDLVAVRAFANECMAIREMWGGEITC